MPTMRPLSLLLTLTVAATAHAQNRLERAQDRRELRQDARERRDDRRDAAKLVDLLRRFDALRAARDYAALTALDTEARDLVGAELRETRREWLKDTAEIHRDRAELGTDRRELARDAARGRGPAVKADDRRDLRDDRRDLRDDRADRRAEARDAARLDALERELAGLWGRVDEPSLDRKRALIQELIGLSVRELAQDRAERREDVRELREDRRETREDRRQR